MSAAIQTIDLPQDEESYQRLLTRLSVQSVKKHFDAYDDVAWDDPEMAIDAEDPRFERDGDDPLGASAWYQAQPAAVRARMGLHMTVHQMKTGVAFENILSRGLLEFASVQPNHSSAYRYAMHELIEEGQHSLMFQEFINRSGLDPAGLGPFDAFTARFVPSLGRSFPELFFFFVLGGEAPIDYVQRFELARGRVSHPLLRKITSIHVTEEARHLCFATHFLRRRVPTLPWWRKAELAVRLPIILRVMVGQMLSLPAAIARAYHVPGRVLRDELAGNPPQRRRIAESLASVRALAFELGLANRVTIPLWRALGVW